MLILYASNGNIIWYLQLLDSCLKSAFLPAYLAASFVKRLSRLLLSVSPSGALVVIALIHNLLRRHPSINCLVHRVKHSTLIFSIYFLAFIIFFFWILCLLIKMEPVLVLIKKGALLSESSRSNLDGPNLMF